jgi:hypothetical protein
MKIKSAVLGLALFTLAAAAAPARAQSNCNYQDSAYNCLDRFRDSASTLLRNPYDGSLRRSLQRAREVGRALEYCWNCGLNSFNQGVNSILRDPSSVRGGYRSSPYRYTYPDRYSSRGAQ